MMYTTAEFAGKRHKSDCWRDRNDCSVIAVAIVCGVRYAKAWYALRKVGRKYRSGVSVYMIQEALEILGFEFKDRYLHAIGATMFDVVPNIDGNALLVSQTHVTAITNNVLHDDPHIILDSRYALCIEVWRKGDVKETSSTVVTPNINEGSIISSDDGISCKQWWHTA